MAASESYEVRVCGPNINDQEKDLSSNTEATILPE